MPAAISASANPRSMTGDRRRWRRRVASAAIIGLFILAVVLSVALGAVPISFAAAFESLLAWLGLKQLDPAYATEQAVLTSIRLPRVLLAILVGGGLAISGAALQGLFRNPLADPGLIGVSGGAALAAVTTIVFSESIALLAVPVLRPYMVPIAAFIGGLLVTLLLQRMAQRGGRTEVATLLLAGIAVNAITMAAIGLLLFISDDQQLRTITLWTLGSLAGRPWSEVLPAVPLILAGGLGLLTMVRPLNALLLGEQEAYHLGFAVEPLKRRMVLFVALATGAAVAVSGLIGFVGLMIPHLIRLLVGVDHRFVLPLSTIGGASLLLLADLAARHVVLPAELPIGILTALFGGPFFLWLLLRRRRAMSHA